MDAASRFLAIRPNPIAQLRLFCFPNAGSGVSLLYSTFRGLPAEIELCPIQLPGREDRRREQPYVRMEPLIRELVSVMEPFLDKPFALFGHSLGALMAFETARQLRRNDLPAPVRLFVSARMAPQMPSAFAPIHRLPDDEFLAELVNRYDAIPAAILAEKELMELFLPVLRADLELLETYAYEPDAPLSTPISVFGGLQDRTVSRFQLEAWQQQTAGSFGLRMFDGNHFFLRNARMEVMKAISDDLPVAAGRDQDSGC